MRHLISGVAQNILPQMTSGVRPHSSPSTTAKKPFETIDPTGANATSAQQLQQPGSTNSGPLDAFQSLRANSTIEQYSHQRAAYLPSGELAKSGTREPAVSSSNSSEADPTPTDQITCRRLADGSPGSLVNVLA